jgi:hypothetical protein
MPSGAAWTAFGPASRGTPNRLNTMEMMTILLIKNRCCDTIFLLKSFFVYGKREMTALLIVMRAHARCFTTVESIKIYSYSPG